MRIGDEELWYFIFNSISQAQKSSQLFLLNCILDNLFAFKQVDVFFETDFRGLIILITLNVLENV